MGKILRQDRQDPKAVSRVQCILFQFSKDFHYGGIFSY